MSTSTSPEEELRARLRTLSLRDEHRLRRRLDGLKRTRDSSKRGQIQAQIEDDLKAAEQRIRSRTNAVPAKIAYPDELPVSQKRAAIAEAIENNQVIIVAGETGSGKTTQLPKICLELGRGVRGAIGHTQPRRLAARTVAQRVAEELKTELGTAVGYQVRFTRQASDDTLIKLMTDGILLNEITRDRMLRSYDTLIIDEAHERSLNIDFILGYLKRLLPRRPDLKVIITSATIDPERFAAHFDDAPIVEVSGRTYPVEIRYREPAQGTDQVQAIIDAVDELSREQPGDILVFLSGEREIRDTADALRRRQLRNTEVLPLYSRLSAAEQHRVFQPGTDRRIVLATNVAETSLTVPGIRYVVDPGTARISRYSNRTKVQRLPIEPISQASARQRTGRCGRLSDGICIRLYSEDDFDRRAVFTDPEILRTNLASVILQMTDLDLGEIASFPFLDPPDKRSVKDGVNLLVELGAIADDNSAGVPGRGRNVSSAGVPGRGRNVSSAGVPGRGRNVSLTKTGRSLAQLPIDPRLARMILEADRNGCAREVLIITAALSIQDVRERPADHQDAADAQHAKFADPTSDFLTYLNLWKYLKEQQNARSSNQFRKMCRTEFLNYLRVREWQDLEAQLRQLVRPLGFTVNRGEPAKPDAIHQALLAGLLSHIGLKSEAINEYQGARNARFAVFPGSALFKKPPKWVMSAELVETSKLWARINARILPEWVEPLAQHLVKRTYSEPHWEQKAGAVIGYEKVLLYGIPIVASRKVNYGRIDPELSRDLFIRHALVEGEWVTNHRFFHENRELLDDAEDLEHKARRRDIVVDDETLFQFYDQRIPADVVSGRHFDSWWKRARRDTPDLLTFTPDLLIRDSADGVSADDYPDTWDGFRLTYQFEPGTDADGVTAHIPLDVLNQVDPDGFTWQVPGLRQELITALIKSLPKQLRRSFVPAPDTARQALAALDEPHGRLTDALGAVLTRLRGVAIPDDAWNWAQVPDHLEITFRVVDDGKVVAEGTDLDALRDELQPKLQQVISSAASSIERNGLTTWDLDTLPTTFQTERGGRVITGYPALVDQGSTVAVRVLKTEAEQESATWAGVRRLLLLSVPSPTAFVQRHLSNRGKLILSSHGPVGDLLEDCAAAAVDALIAEASGPPRDQSGFDALRERVRAELIDSVFAIVADVEKILEAAAEVRSRLGTTSSLALAPSLLDARTHLESLIAPGFVTATGPDRLRDLLRYVRAIGRRLDKLPASPQRDRTHQATVEHMTEEWEAAGKPDDARWMIEELRVSLFGQELGTKFPISEKRILRALDTHAP